MYVKQIYVSTKIRLKFKVIKKYEHYKLMNRKLKVFKKRDLDRPNRIKLIYLYLEI